MCCAVPAPDLDLFDLNASVRKVDQRADKLAAVMHVQGEQAPPG
jgi:hypothetical protein